MCRATNYRVFGLGIGILAVLMCGQVARAQDEGFMDDALVSLPIEDEIPGYRPEVPPATTQPAPAPAPAPAPQPSTQPATQPSPEASPCLTGDWWGYRTRMAEKGITWDVRLIGEASHNLRGGLDTESTVGQYLLNVNLSLDTEPLLGWKGGTFFANFQSHGGQSPTDELTGDWQWTSTITAPRRDQLSEIWYQQYLADDKVKVAAGKIDITRDFAYADNASAFIHAGMGFPITAAYLPTYPEPAFGATAFVYPTEHCYAGAGIFDGALQEGMHTGGNGPRTLFGPPADLLLIGEVGHTWSLGERKLGGRVRLGGIWQTGTLDEFTGGQRDGAPGAYILVDQRLWRASTDENDARGFTCFAGYDWADPDVFEAEHHITAGVTWIGPIPSRQEDSLGLGVSWVRFSGDADFSDSDETAIELFYRIQATPWLSVTLDLQQILNPGGDGLDDALLATVRVELAI